MSVAECQERVAVLRASVQRLKGAPVDYTREYVRHRIQLTIYEMLLATKEK